VRNKTKHNVLFNENPEFGLQTVHIYSPQKSKQVVRNHDL